MGRKKEFRQEVRAFGLEEIRNRLKELQKEKMNQEMRVRGYTGDMLVPMLKNRIANEHGASVDLKNVRHQIAFIKQTIKEKENEKI